MRWRGRLADLKFTESYFASMQKMLPISELEQATKPKIIQIGSGKGIITQQLHELLPKNVEFFASEYSDDLVTATKQLNPNVAAFRQSAYYLKDSDETYDVVVLLGVLEKLEHPEDALDQVRRVLKPGGVAVIGIRANPFRRLVNYYRKRFASGLRKPKSYLNVWSKKSICNFIKSNVGPVEASASSLTYMLARAKKD